MRESRTSGSVGALGRQLPRATRLFTRARDPAAIQGVRATLMEPQEVMRELGYDPEQVPREWQAFAKLVDELEFVSDIDRSGRPAKARA